MEISFSSVQALAMKRLSIFNPTGPLFSGWNWTPVRLSLRTAAHTPAAVVVAVGEVVFLAGQPAPQTSARSSRLRPAGRLRKCFPAQSPEAGCRPFQPICGILCGGPSEPVFGIALTLLQSGPARHAGRTLRSHSSASAFRRKCRARGRPAAMICNTGSARPCALSAATQLPNAPTPGKIMIEACATSSGVVARIGRRPAARDRPRDAAQIADAIIDDNDGSH